MRPSAAWVVLGLGLACRPAAVGPAEPSDAAVEPAAPPAPSPTRDPDAPPALPPPNARLSASGVAVLVLEHPDPDGLIPATDEMIEARFSVWDETGRRVGASRDGRAERLSMGWLPPGWAEAMSTLHAGDHAQIWIPADQAYAAHPNAPQGALVIDIELVSVDHIEPPATEPSPTPVPPSNALRTASGIAFMVLREGNGTQHPTETSTVTVHYDGWTASDLARFDSSYEREQPASFKLTRVIKGWQQAVPLMVEGEKTRFWIPAELAYGDRPHGPQGTLIFDVELLSIDD